MAKTTKPESSMQLIYDEMKAALTYFGLRFHDMDKVEMYFEVGSGNVVFEYEGRKIVLRSYDEKESTDGR